MSCEQPVDVPAEIAGSAVQPVAAAEQPEASAPSVLDLEIFGHGMGLAAMLPPFAVDPPGPVGLAHTVGLAAPGETQRRLVGKLGDDLVDRLGVREQADRARPVGRPAVGFTQRRDPADAAFGNVAFDAAQAEYVRRSDTPG